MVVVKPCHWHFSNGFLDIIKNFFNCFFLTIFKMYILGDIAILHFLARLKSSDWKPCKHGHSKLKLWLILCSNLCMREDFVHIEKPSKRCLTYYHVIIAFFSEECGSSFFSFLRFCLYAYVISLSYCSASFIMCTKVAMSIFRETLVPTLLMTQNLVTHILKKSCTPIPTFFFSLLLWP